MVCRLLIGDMSDKDIQFENSQIGVAIRTRDNIHKQTTFIIFFSFFKKYVTGILTENAV